MQCLNCGKETSGNFCQHCGQKTSVEKLALKKEINNFLSSITNFDKGIYKNIIGLTLNPKLTISNYLEGKRKYILNPLTYAFMMLTILVLIDQNFADHNLLNFEKRQFEIDDNSISPFALGVDLGELMSNYFKYLWFLLIPVLAFWNWLFDAKKSYAEHIAINAFVVGHAALITICCFIFYKRPIIFNGILYFAVFLYTGIVYYKPNKKLDSLFHLLSPIMGFLALYTVPVLFFLLIRWLR